MMRIPDKEFPVRQGLPLFALALSLLCPIAAEAKVFRCVADSGEISFSQTPCPKPRKQEQDDLADLAVTAPDPDPDDTSDVASKDNEVSAPVDADAKPEPVLQAKVEEVKQPENEALRAQRQQADAREEEYRLQCEKNLNSQIDSINAQMRADYSSSLLESLKMKRRAVEERLQGC